MTRLGVALLGCLLGAVGCVGGSVVHFDRSAETQAADLPFSDAVRVGDLIFVSGQLGIRPGENELVPGGIEAETAQCLENIRTILERNGSSLARVVKCTVFLAEMDDWPAMNAVYRRYFPGALPARSAFAAAGLAYRARIELECIAAAGEAPELLNKQDRPPGQR